MPRGMREVRAVLRARWKRNPWWIPVFLGSVPDIDPALVQLLGLVALALFFEQYDLSMLTSALKFIAEDLGVPGEHLGRYLSIIRLGALPAFLVVPFADRFGRRRVFLVSMLGMSLTTFLTGFSPNIEVLVAFQMLTRTFMIACTAVAVVIITEEFPAEHRGWGIGMVGALAACGYGLGAAVFAAIDILPYGWRTLYGIGVVPFLLLPLFRRQVQETGRFRRHRDRHAADRHGSAGQWVEPILRFARTYPRRVLGISLASGLTAVGTICAFQFTGYFTLNVHGWSPGQFSAMVLLGGSIGIVGNVIAGAAGDRFGRRVVGSCFLAALPLFAALFYEGPGWIIPLAFAGIVFCSTAGQVIIRALATELFPTSQRGTASGFVAVIDTLGAATGLAILGLGTQAPGDIARMTVLLSFSVLVGGLALFLLPETRSRELESISGED